MPWIATGRGWPRPGRVVVRCPTFAGLRGRPWSQDSFLRRLPRSKPKPPDSLGPGAGGGPGEGSGAGAVSPASGGPPTASFNAAGLSGANENNGASLLMRKTSRTDSSTLQKMSRPPCLTRHAIERHEVAQRGRPRIADPVEVDHQFRPAPGPQMRFVFIAKVHDRGGVEAETIPELRDQDPAFETNLYRGLEHEYGGSAPGRGIRFANDNDSGGPG